MSELIINEDNNIKLLLKNDPLKKRITWNGLTKIQIHPHPKEGVDEFVILSK